MQTGKPSTKQTGDAAEDAALEFLQRQGLRLLMRNYRTQGRGGGEIDLILQESDGTVVFAEVRKRTQPRFGGPWVVSVAPNSGALFLQPAIFCGVGVSCRPLGLT